MLSDSKLKQCRGKISDSQQVLSDRDGLCVRVSPKGKVTFFIRYRFKGKQDQISIGTYPAMSLKAARERNLELKGCLEQGHDPKVVKRLEVINTSNKATFLQMAEAWYKKVASQKLANHEKDWRSLEIHVFSQVGQLPADSISDLIWLDLFEKIQTKAPGLIAILLNHSKSIYAFGVRRRFVESNPLRDITPRRDLNFEYKKGQRCLNNKELARLKLYLDAETHDYTMRSRQIILTLALHFGCRISELRHAEIGHEHFDFEEMVWTVPPANHKTGRRSTKSLKRPIIPPIAELIKELSNMSMDSVHLVTGILSGKQLGMSFWVGWPKHINKWLERNGHEPIASWSIHDLRKTMRTNVAPLTPPHVAEMMLGHALPGVWRIYDTYDYLDEQRLAYQAWWERYQSI